MGIILISLDMLFFLDSSFPPSLNLGEIFSCIPKNLNLAYTGLLAICLILRDKDVLFYKNVVLVKHHFWRNIEKHL